MNQPNLEAELDRLGELRHVGHALAEFAVSLLGSGFKRQGQRWVMRGQNWVDLQIHYKRATNIVFGLYGNAIRHGLKTHPKLDIRWIRNSRIEFIVRSRDDLDGAAFYLRQAAELRLRSGLPTIGD